MDKCYVCNFVMYKDIRKHTRRLPNNSVKNNPGIYNCSCFVDNANNKSAIILHCYTNRLDAKIVYQDAPALLLSRRGDMPVYAGAGVTPPYSPKTKNPISGIDLSATVRLPRVIGPRRMDASKNLDKTAKVYKKRAKTGNRTILGCRSVAATVAGKKLCILYIFLYFMG